MKSKIKKDSNQPDSYYMYGKHAVFAAIDNPKRIIKKIYCTEKLLANNPDLKSKTIDIEILDNHSLTKKLKMEVNHQGIIALVKSIFLSNIEEFDFLEQTDRIAILDQITDPQNIGTIIRSAAAFNINKIIVTKDHAPEENGAIAKAACGSLELVQIAKIVNLNQIIKKLKDRGFWIAGTTGEGATKITDLQKIEKLAIIIGSEEKGMRDLTLKSCDYQVAIPINPKVQSLNAASAASIAFFCTLTT